MSFGRHLNMIKKKLYFTVLFKGYEKKEAGNQPLASFKSPVTSYHCLSYFAYTPVLSYEADQMKIMWYRHRTSDVAHITGCFFSIMIYQIINTTPLKILEMLMAHQIPSRPRLVEDKISAPGIRSRLNNIPVTDGGIVLPIP